MIIIVIVIVIVIILLLIIIMKMTIVRRVIFNTSAVILYVSGLPRARGAERRRVPPDLLHGPHHLHNYT